MQRRNENTKIECENDKGVVKMLMPSVVRNEAKKINGFRPVNNTKAIPKKAAEVIEGPIADDFQVDAPDIQDETVTEKKKPGRKPNKK